MSGFLEVLRRSVEGGVPCTKYTKASEFCWKHTACEGFNEGFLGTMQVLCEIGQDLRRPVEEG